MGIVSRQATISSSIAFLGVALGYFNLLYLMPTAMSPDQIGLYRVLIDIALVFLPFAQVGVVQSLTKFFPAYKDHKGFFAFTLTLMLSGFVFFLLLFFLFKNQIISLFETNSPEINEHLSVIIGLIFINLMASLLEAYSKSTLDIVTPNFSRDIVARLLTTGYVTLYLFEYITFHSLLNGLLVITGSSTLIMLAVLLAKGKISFSFNFSFLSKEQFKLFMTFSLFSLMGSSGMLILGKIDSIMVTSMLGLFENGIYIIAFYIATVIEIPKRHILQITAPLIADSFSKSKLSDIHELYTKASLNLLIIGTLLLIGIWSNINNIYYLMPNHEIYDEGKMVVLLIGIGKLIDVASGPNGIIISMSNHYKWNILFVITLAVLTIGLNYVLIPIYGIVGAAMASALTYLIFNLLKFVFIQVRFKMHPFSKKWIIIAIATGIALFVNSFIPFLNHTLIDIPIRSLVMTVIFMGPILLLRISPDLNTFLKKIAARVFRNS